MQKAAPIVRAALIVPSKKRNVFTLPFCCCCSFLRRAADVRHRGHAASDQLKRKTVSTWELSCFSLVTRSRVFRVCPDSLYQRGSRSSVSLGRILMFLTDYLLKCLWSFQSVFALSSIQVKSKRKYSAWSLLQGSAR